MKLADAFSLIRNGASIKQYDNATGTPITRIETISNRVVDRNKCGYADVFDIEKYQDYVLQDGDILMSHINSVQHLGKTALYNKIDGEVLIHGMNLLVLRPKREILEPNYAYIALNSLKFLRQLPRITKKSVNQASFSVNDLKQTDIDVPSISKQKEIAHTVMQIDRMIANRQQALSVVNELVKSRFVEMFGDPVSNSMGWKIVKLVDVCDKVTDGTHFSPESYAEGDYKYVTAKNIKESGFDFTNITYVTKDIHSDIFSRCNPEYGDVLYIKDGVTTGIAMVNTLHEEFSLLSSVALIKQKRDVLNGIFLCAVLNNANMYRTIRSMMGGAAITRLTVAKIKPFKIIIPPINLQNQFADFVVQTDKSKLAVQQSIDTLQTLKEKLMQDYFG